MTNKTNLFEITNFTIGDFFFEKSCWKIWWVQKKAVSLQCK
jgi:hypothetical protein